MLNNGFPVHKHKTPTHRHPTTTSDGQRDTTTRKMGFLYIPWQRDYLYYKLIKKTDWRIELRSNNTTQRLLMQIQRTPDKYTRFGAYKLTCPDCNKAYIGQTGGASLRGSTSTKMHLKPTATRPVTPNTS